MWEGNSEGLRSRGEETGVMEGQPHLHLRQFHLAVPEKSPHVQGP